MMNRSLMCSAMLTAWIGVAATSQGQEDPPPAGDVRDLLRKMDERIDALERQHDADQDRIRELEQRLTRMEQPTEEPQYQKDFEQLRSEIRSELAETQRPAQFGLGYSGGGSGNALNPQITVFLDMGASVSSKGSNKALNRFNLREVELDLRAAVSPSVDGALILAVGEEIESQRFGDVQIDRTLDLEEGFLDFHTLPHGLALKVGKFRNAIGRNNQLHTHDLPQVTRPLVIQSFLGPEGLSATGASLNWLVPNPWDKYVEATLEVVNADGGEESPILGGPNADNPAVVGHIKLFEDLTDTSSLELGASYLYGRTSSDPDFDANLFGLDVAYQWTDEDPSKFRSMLLQAETFWSHNDVDRGPFLSRRNDAFGAYAFAQYQFGQNWYCGLRGDYTEYPNSETRSASDYDVAVSPYITWYQWEFLRFRLQYEHRWIRVRRDTGDEDAVYLQITGVIGSHPPHPYWVRR